MPPAAPDPTMTTSGSKSRVTAPALWASVFPAWAIGLMALVRQDPKARPSPLSPPAIFQAAAQPSKVSGGRAVSSREIATGRLAGGAHETQEISHPVARRFHAGALAGRRAGAAGLQAGSHRQCRFARQDGAGD